MVVLLIIKQKSRKKKMNSSSYPIGKNADAITTDAQMNGYGSMAASADDQGYISVTRIDGIASNPIQLIDYEYGLQTA